MDQLSLEAELKPLVSRLFVRTRARLNLTQSELGQAMGISQSAVSKIEAGIFLPSMPQWVAFCDATHTDLDSVFLPKNIPNQDIPT